MSPRSPITILLAEDDSRAREIGALILGAEGFRVLEAANGSVALAAVCSDPSIDVLLSDITMPGGIDGIQLARRLQDLPYKVRVVLTSGDPQESFTDFPSEVSFLPKPYDRQALLAAVNAVLPQATAH